MPKLVKEWKFNLATMSLYLDNNQYYLLNFYSLVDNNMTIPITIYSEHGSNIISICNMTIDEFMDFIGKDESYEYSIPSLGFVWCEKEFISCNPIGEKRTIFMSKYTFINMIKELIDFIIYCYTNRGIFASVKKNDDTPFGYCMDCEFYVQNEELNTEQHIQEVCMKFPHFQHKIDRYEL